MPAVIVFFGIENNSKVNVLLASSVANFDAGQNIGNVVEILQGKGGGGKKDLAMGSGCDSNKTTQALDFIVKVLTNNTNSHL